jgi:hypothetical protein
MDDGWVVCHELDWCLRTDGSNHQTFGIVGLVISFTVNALDNIMGTLFAYTGT